MPMAKTGKASTARGDCLFGLLGAVLIVALVATCSLVSSGCASGTGAAGAVDAGASEPTAADASAAPVQKSAETDGSASPDAAVDGQTPAMERYEAGTYLVGEDLPAEEYVLEPAPSGRYVVFAEPGCEEPIDEGLFEGQAILTVADGQQLVLDHAIAVPFDQYPHELNPDRRAGTYKAGVDIPEGTYRAVAPGEDRGYWGITDSSSVDRVAVAANTFSGSDTFTIEEGQYLRFNRCNISLVE